LRSDRSFASVLPFVLAGTTLATLMSQGLDGSTFAIFPLLSLTIASLVLQVGRSVPAPPRLAPVVGLVICALLGVSGLSYTLTDPRLRFIDVDPPGPPMRSTFPTLLGLSARGPYIGDLDQILEWTSVHVRPDEAMVFLPGEDPVFYALERRPALRSVFFY